MNLRIIWIDDSQIWVRSVKESIEEAFTNNDLTPEILEFQNTDDAFVEILDSYADLILVDYNLPGQRNGDALINDLRKNRCFAHIVFYSQDVANLTIVNPDKHYLDTTPRDDISDRMEIVAEQIYRKYKHPAFMRGMLLSDFIDLENLMETLISQFFKSEAEFFRENIIYNGGESYSLATKQKFISRILRSQKIDEADIRDNIDNIGFSANSFATKIIKKRNVLAHAHPEYDDKTGNIILMSSIDQVEFTGEWFDETRIDIYKFKKKIRQLLSLELYKIVNP